MILITTCRRPTERIRSFASELSHSIPKCRRINRGKLSLEALAERCFELGCDKALILQRWMGGPGRIELLELRNSNLTQISPLLCLADVKLRREYNTVGRFEAEAVTVQSKAGSEILQLAKSLSNFLELPLVTLPCGGSYRVALHVLEHSRRKAKVVLGSPPPVREIGPSLTIKHSSWENLGDENHRSGIRSYDRI